MINVKIGMAEMSIVGGWPVSRQTSRYRYEDVEHTPVMEEYDAPAYLHRESRIDLQGDVRVQEWLEYERRERQIGVNEIRYERIGTHTTFRIRYDDGRCTAAFTPPSAMRYDTRCYCVTVKHPLVSGAEQFWITGDGIVHGRHGWWRRAVTARAARAAGLIVSRQRTSILGSIPRRSPYLEPEGVHDGWRVCEGHWNARKSTLSTPHGEITLPGRTDGLADGEIVSIAYHLSPTHLIVERWMSAGTIDRPWRRTFAPLGHYVGRYGASAAILSAAAACALYGVLSHGTAALLLGTAVLGWKLYSIATREVSTVERYESRPHVLERAVGRMRDRLWQHARLAHDRSLGWQR